METTFFQKHKRLILKISLLVLFIAAHQLLYRMGNHTTPDSQLVK